MLPSLTFTTIFNPHICDFHRKEWLLP